jgi:hypothetical protein
MERSKLKMSWLESNSRSLYDGVYSFLHLEAMPGQRKIKMERSKLKMSWLESNSRSLYDGVYSFLYLEAV